MQLSRWKLVLALAAVAATARAGEDDPADGQGVHDGAWRHYSGDVAGTKYSDLDQIDRDNVGELAVAWRWSSPENELMAANRRLGTIAFEGTPIMIPEREEGETWMEQDGVLYVSTSLSQVAAIDAKSGATLWVYDPESWKAGRPTNLGFVHRGVAYWTNGEIERLFIGTGDSRLISIDAKTGKPDTGFGIEGMIDLTQGLRRPVDRGSYAVTSPPLVCRDVVMVGSSIFDGPTVKTMPPGDVRGFDVRTGELRWNFHTIPQEGEFGNETWEDGSWEYTGNANVWTLMTCDPELGYVYLPVGTPTNDWYGGHRPGAGLFGESLVCLDAETGERIWHFQTTHHGLWDYDLPAGPILADIEVDGEPVKAVVQLSKQGWAFVFDRVTGEPVWPIEEREVPQSDVPGEKSHPTQPFPTKPPAFEQQGVTEDDLIDLTPELKAEALELAKEHDLGPMYSPPTLKGRIVMPGWGGGPNWNGAAFDPETNMLYVPSHSSPIRVQLIEPDPARSDMNYIRGGSQRVDGPQGLPLVKPPWSRLTAIDLNEGEVAWQEPLGEGPRDHPALEGLDLPYLGSGTIGFPVATKTLLFVAQGARSGRSHGPGGAGEEPKPLLNVFDKKTGELLEEIELPASSGGGIVTYMVEGRQYIVIPVGGKREPSELVALALPVEGEEVPAEVSAAETEAGSGETATDETEADEAISGAQDSVAETAAQ